MSGIHINWSKSGWVTVMSQHTCWHSLANTNTNACGVCVCVCFMTTVVLFCTCKDIHVLSLGKTEHHFQFY
jgi:hypothetical protein